MALAFTIKPTDQDLFSALELFLQRILPAGDAMFTGQVSGTELTVIEMEEGTIQVGDQLLGVNVQPNTYINAQVSGDPGGPGTYTLSVDQGTDIPACTMATFAEIIQAQLNRVPEPRVADFALMTIIRYPRLATNLDLYADATFTGSIAGNILTVESMTHGELVQGAPVYGVDVVPGTTLRAPGVDSQHWIIGPEQTVSSRAMAGGLKKIMQSSQAVVQVDFHGPNSANLTKIVTSVFRDDTGVTIFAEINPNIIPLFCEDPRQMPFRNGEQQYETRYIIEANFQVNQTVSVGQDFAAEVEVARVEVETRWPLP